MASLWLFNQRRLLPQQVWPELGIYSDRLHGIAVELGRMLAANAAYWAKRTTQLDKYTCTQGIEKNVFVSCYSCWYLKYFFLPIRGFCPPIEKTYCTTISNHRQSDQNAFCKNQSARLTVFILSPNVFDVFYALLSIQQSSSFSKTITICSDSFHFLLLFLFFYNIRH